MIYLLISFLALYTFLAWHRPDWSVMLFLLALPSYQVRFDAFGIPMTLLEAMILISFAVWLIKNRKVLFENLKFKIKNCFKIENCKLKIKTHRYPFDIEIVLMLLIAFISVAVAGFSDSAFGVFKAYFFEPILAYILIINVLKNNFKKIIWPLALSALCVSLYAVLQKLGILHSPENFLPRVTGVFFYPNAVGLYLGQLVPVLIGFLFLGNMKHETGNKNIFENFVLSIIIALSLPAIFFAKSEGALIGLSVAFFVMFIFWIFAKFKLNFLFPEMLMAVILFFVLISPFIFLKIVPEHKYFDFNSKTLNYISDKTMLKDFSGEVRKQQWRETWQMLSASPKNFLFGVGLSGYQTSVKPYHQEGIFFNKDRDADFRAKIVLFDENYKHKHWRPVEIYMYPHNFILNIWSELGLAGLVLFVWIIIKSIKYLALSIKGGNFIAIGLLGAIIVIIVHGLVDVPYFKNDLSVMFWVIIAILGIINLDIKSQEKNI